MLGRKPQLRFAWVAELVARTADGGDARVVARSEAAFENPREAASDAQARTWEVAQGVIGCDGDACEVHVSAPDGAKVPDLAPEAAVEVVSTALEARVCEA